MGQLEVALQRTKEAGLRSGKEGEEKSDHEREKENESDGEEDEGRDLRWRIKRAQEKVDQFEAQQSRASRKAKEAVRELKLKLCLNDKEERKWQEEGKEKEAAMALTRKMLEQSGARLSRIKSELVVSDCCLQDLGSDLAEIEAEEHHIQREIGALRNRIQRQRRVNTWIEASGLARWAIRTTVIITHLEPESLAGPFGICICVAAVVFLVLLASMISVANK